MAFLDRIAASGYSYLNSHVSDATFNIDRILDGSTAAGRRGIAVEHGPSLGIVRRLCDRDELDGERDSGSTPRNAGGSVLRVFPERNSADCTPHIFKPRHRTDEGSSRIR